MQYAKWFAGLALTVGMGFAGASTLSAAEPYGRDAYRDRQEQRIDYRDNSRINRLRAEVAQDRERLREDIRRGRQWEVRRDREELARDQRMLDNLLRDSSRGRDNGYSNGFRPR
jgi:hypothetical protein